VTYEMKIERVLDAPPDIVFDTIVDPAGQDEIFADIVEGWTVQRFDIDLRLGGTWTVEFGPRDGKGPNDVLTSVFTEVDRPRRLAYDTTMYVAEWNKTVPFSEVITFEKQDGKTLLTVVQSGFETEADRDAFQSGTPDWFDAVQRAAEARAGAVRGEG
jgi:uncharacterized protein YndB with AHSA1/START domain